MQDLLDPQSYVQYEGHITDRNRRHGKFLLVIRSRLEFRDAGLSPEGKEAQVFRQGYETQGRRSHTIW
jgi:hypothetical protein